MDTIFLIILIIIHLVWALLLLLLPSSRLRNRKEYLIPVLLVPLFGPLFATTIEILFLLKKTGTVAVDLESLKLTNDIFWTAFNPVEEDRDVVPLEEAILIDNVRIRRKALLTTFRDDSQKFLNVLMVARDNEDVDTTHYATIQISKIQRQFQLKLQEYAAGLRDDPNNLNLLNAYIDLLDEYLKSPLLEKTTMHHQRIVYGELLDRKLALVGSDQSTSIQKLRNCTALKEDYPSVLSIVAELKERWPADEQTWINALRAFVEWKDRDMLQETINEIKKHEIAWTKYGREAVSPWVR